jgi:hypothetical protein
MFGPLECKVLLGLQKKKICFLEFNIHGPFAVLVIQILDNTGPVLFISWVISLPGYHAHLPSFIEKYKKIHHF